MVSVELPGPDYSGSSGKIFVFEGLKSSNYRGIPCKKIPPSHLEALLKDTELIG